MAMTDHACLALVLILSERRRSISSSVQGCGASGSASAAAASVLVDGVASRCPRVGLDAIQREEVLSRVRRARFLSGGDGGVGGVQ